MYLRRLIFLPLALLLGGWFGYSSLHEAPDGMAAVREHTIVAPRNDPPIKSTYDFTVTAVDGVAPRRETLPPWVDLPAGVLLPAGTHRLTARVAPHVLPAGYQPKEVSFTVKVESRKVYFLVDDKDGAPILIAEHPVGG